MVELLCCDVVLLEGDVVDELSVVPRFVPPGDDVVLEAVDPVLDVVDIGIVVAKAHADCKPLQRVKPGQMLMSIGKPAG